MEWTDDGIVLGTRKHGEASAIVELMTRAHGRHLGLVRGGAGSRLRPVLQPGNVLQVVWRARLDEHLGYYTVDALNLRAGKLLGAAHAVYAVNHLAALVRLCLRGQDLYSTRARGSFHTRRGPVRVGEFGWRCLACRWASMCPG